MTHCDPLLAAWETFVDHLRSAGESILTPHEAVGDRDRSEGIRFLTRLTSATFDMYLDYGDALRPRFVRLMGERRKFFGDNPDADYDFATIDGGHSYLIRGVRGTNEYLACCVYGRDEEGAATILANLSDRDLTIADDGSFTIYLSAAAPGPDVSSLGPVDWVALSPDTENVVVRQYYLDRARERPGRFQIECLSRPADHEPPVDEYAGRLVSAGEFIANGAAFTAAAAQFLAASPNELPIDSRNPVVNAFYPTPDNKYLAGWYRIRENEALTIEGQAPSARYWSLLLMSHWMESLDDHHDSTSLNSGDIEIAEDGSFRIVVAHTDPGTGNWLNTAGRTQGYLMFRWMQTDDVATPRLTVVPSSSLGTRTS